MFGLSDPYRLTTKQKDTLVAACPEAKKLLRPYMEGEHSGRWAVGESDMWCLAMKSSGDHAWPWASAKTEAEAEATFRTTYPGLHAHFAMYEQKLKSRGDKGKFWWELRTCSYWDEFEKPKVVYQDLTWSLTFAMDRGGKLANNTVYFLPIEDTWILAVLNAPVTWWLAWRDDGRTTTSVATMRSSFSPSRCGRKKLPDS
jgi:hypothetical protein